MNRLLSDQIHVFWVFLLVGVSIGLLHDFIIILRRLFHHRKWLVGLEDICFWTAVGLFVFIMIDETNGGMLRGFIFVGLLLSFLTYKFLISPWLVKKTTKVLEKFIFILRKLFGFIFFPIIFLIKKVVWGLIKIKKCTIMCLRRFKKDIYIIRKKI